MRIRVRLDVSQKSSVRYLTLDDLDVTEKEWLKMSDDDKRELIENTANEMPETPYWIVDSFDEV